VSTLQQGDEISGEEILFLGALAALQFRVPRKLAIRGTCDRKVWTSKGEVHAAKPLFALATFNRLKSLGMIEDDGDNVALRLQVEPQKSMAVKLVAHTHPVLALEPLQ
jgi:hypothetical protein